MSEYWVEHLAKTLSEQNIVVYIWYIDEDRMEWAGDLYGAFGFEKEDVPRSQAAFNQFINPQDIAERYLAVVGALDDFEKHQAINKEDSFSLSYTVRCKNGSHIGVKEQASLHRYSVSGQRLLCGTLFVDQGQQMLPVDRGSTDILVTDCFDENVRSDSVFTRDAVGA